MNDGNLEDILMVAIERLERALHIRDLGPPGHPPTVKLVIVHSTCLYFSLLYFLISSKSLIGLSRLTSSQGGQAAAGQN